MKTQQPSDNIEDEDGFRKSSFSVRNPVIRFCVSVRMTKDAVTVRDTKDLTKRTLSFSLGEWEAFIKGVKDGEFDLSTS